MDQNQFRHHTTQTFLGVFQDTQVMDYAGAAWFPANNVPDKEVSLEVRRLKRLMAADVQRGTAGTLNKFSNSTQRNYIPPYYKEFFNFNELKRYDITFNNLQSNGYPIEYQFAKLINEGMDELMILRDKIAISKENQRWQTMTTGVVTMVNGDSIDFKRKAASMVVKTSTATWDNFSTAAIYSDLNTGCSFLQQEGKSGNLHFDFIMGQNVYGYVENNVELQNKARFYNQLQRVDIGMPQYDKVQGLAWQGRIGVGAYTVDLWSYPGYYDNVDGSHSYFLDADTGVLMARDFVGQHVNAGVPAIMGDAGVNQFVGVNVGEYYMRQYIDQQSSNWRFEISAAPVPVPIFVDRMWTVKTK